jgi:hypothetical protein
MSFAKAWIMATLAFRGINKLDVLLYLLAVKDTIVVLTVNCSLS